MKVQKVVSQRMANFSKWVRVGLNNFDQGIDPTTQLMEETRQKAKWAKISNLLAGAMVAKYIEHDPTYEGTVEDLIFKAVKEVNKQKSLEEFE